MTEDLEALRRRSDELDKADEAESDEVVQINRALFEADPTSSDVCNRLGIALVNRDELEEALIVFERGLAAEPRNAIGRRRREEIAKTLDERPALTAAELIEPAFETLDVAGRAACISFMAASIREIVALDGDFLAVTESEPPHRFRIWCGMVTVCAPSGDRLAVRMHEVGSRGLIDRIQTAGGEILGAEKTAVPNGEWMGIPVARLNDFRDEVLEAHRRLLPEAIAAGKNPELAKRRHDLRDYLLDQARTVDRTPE